MPKDYKNVKMQNVQNVTFGFFRDDDYDEKKCAKCRLHISCWLWHGLAYSAEWDRPRTSTLQNACLEAASLLIFV